MEEKMDQLAVSRYTNIFKISQSQNAWLVILAATSFFFFQFLQMTMFNSLNSFLIGAFTLTQAQLGYLSSSYYCSSILSLIPAGIILDYFSAKRVMITAISGSICAILIFAWTSSFAMAVGARFISGMFGAFCMLSAVRLATRWFPHSRLAIVIGVIVSVGLIGGIVAQTPITYLLNAIGWRNTLLVLAAIGLIIIGIISIFVRDFPDGECTDVDKISLKEHCQNIKYACSRYENWLIGLYISCMNFPILVLGAMWGNQFLISIFGMNRMASAEICTMLFFGMIIGSPIMGWISDSLGSRKMPMLLAAILLSFTYGTLFLGIQFDFSTLMVIFFVIGLLSSTQVLGYPLLAESNSPRVTGTVEGLGSTVMIAGGLMQSVYGIILHQSNNDYRLATLILPIGSLLSLVIALYFYKRKDIL